MRPLALVFPLFFAVPAVAEEIRWRGFKDGLEEARKTRRAALVFLANTE